MANPPLEFVDLGLGPYVHGTPSKKFPVYTRGNSGEVYPEVVYPFSTSLPGVFSADPFTESIRVIGAMTEKELQEDANIHGGVFGGYTYINLSASRVIAVRTPGTTVEETDATFLGSENLAPPHKFQRGDRNVWCSIKMTIYALSTLYRKRLDVLEQSQNEAIQWHKELPDFSNISDEELLNVFLDSVPLQVRLFRDHLLITGGAGIGLGLLKTICKNKLGDESLVLPLLGGIGDVESAAPSFALWDLSRIVRNSLVLSECFNQDLEGLVKRLEAESEAKKFNEEFKSFLEQFGSRGPNEWEMACEVWGTNPQMPLVIIDRMRQADDSRAPILRSERLVEEREKAVESAIKLTTEEEREADPDIWSTKERLQEEIQQTLLDVSTLLVDEPTPHFSDGNVIPKRLIERDPPGLAGTGYWDLYRMTEEMKERDPKMIYDSIRVIGDEIWNWADGERSVNDIAARIGAEFDFDLESRRFIRLYQKYILKRLFLYNCDIAHQ